MVDRVSAKESARGRIAESLESTLVPALHQHGEILAKSSQVAGDQLSQQCRRLFDALDEAQHLARTSTLASAQKVVDCLNHELKPAMIQHATSLDQSAQVAAERFEHQAQLLTDTLGKQSATLSAFASF